MKGRRGEGVKESRSQGVKQSRGDGVKIVPPLQPWKTIFSKLKNEVSRIRFGVRGPLINL